MIKDQRNRPLDLLRQKAVSVELADKGPRLEMNFQMPRLEQSYTS